MNKVSLDAPSLVVWLNTPFADAGGRRLSAAYNATLELNVDALEANVVARLITAATAAAAALGKYAPDLLEPDDEAALDLLEEVLMTIKRSKGCKNMNILISAETDIALRLRTAAPADLQQAVEAVRGQLAAGELPVRRPLELTGQEAAQINATYLFDLYAGEIVERLPARPTGNAG